MTDVPARGETIRRDLRTLLESESVTIRDISGALGVSEKDVVPHLEHLARSLRGRSSAGRLVVEPAVCLKCDFSFDERTRTKAPGRCPKCKSERISAPVFRIE